MVSVGKNSTETAAKAVEAMCDLESVCFMLDFDWTFVFGPLPAEKGPHTCATRNERVGYHVEVTCVPGTEWGTKKGTGFLPQRQPGSPRQVRLPHEASAAPSAGAGRSGGLFCHRGLWTCRRDRPDLPVTYPQQKYNCNLLEHMAATRMRQHPWH